MLKIEDLSGGRYKRLHLIGDSHFALHEPVVGVMPHHVGPVTMHRVGRDGPDCLNLSAIAARPADAVGFVFGEIDIRVHIANQRDLSRKSAEEILSVLAERYFDTISKAIRMLDLDRGVIFSCVPPAGLNHPNFDHGYPRNGSDIERVEWTKQLNYIIRILSDQRGLGYVDQYTSFANPDGLLRLDFTIDGAHVRADLHRLVDWSAAF